MSTCVLGLLPQSYWYPNLSEGADRVGGQLRGDKECPFRGVTISGRVWRKVPKSDARSVVRTRLTIDVIWRLKLRQGPYQCHDDDPFLTRRLGRMALIVTFPCGEFLPRYLGCLVGFTRLMLSCLRRGTGGSNIP